MDIIVKEELRVYIDPLTPEEHDALERSILAEGCRDALVLWGNVLVDGHNRYGICSKHGIPFQTVQNPRFKSMEDVHLWMIDQHLGRRSVSDFQRGVLALRKKAILQARAEAAAHPAAPADAALQGDGEGAPPDSAASAAPGVMSEEERAAAEALASREALARAARISPTTVAQIEKIQKHAAPELVEAVKQGTISINAAATVATLPMEEQVAAAAGGRKELQQAARQVREARRQAREGRHAEVSEMLEGDAGQPAPQAAPWEAIDAADDGPRPGETPDETIARLVETVRTLRNQNAMLAARVTAMEG